jgi:hypothetical protein
MASFRWKTSLPVRRRPSAACMAPHGGPGEGGGCSAVTRGVCYSGCRGRRWRSDQPFRGVEVYHSAEGAREIPRQGRVGVSRRRGRTASFPPRKMYASRIKGASTAITKGPCEERTPPSTPRAVIRPKGRYSLENSIDRAKGDSVESALTHRALVMYPCLS